MAKKNIKRKVKNASLHDDQIYQLNCFLMLLFLTSSFYNKMLSPFHHCFFVFFTQNWSDFPPCWTIYSWFVHHRMFRQSLRVIVFGCLFVFVSLCFGWSGHGFSSFLSYVSQVCLKGTIQRCTTMAITPTSFHKSAVPLLQ